jgi:hypothetical protein
MSQQRAIAISQLEINNTHIWKLLLAWLKMARLTNKLREICTSFDLTFVCRAG